MSRDTGERKEKIETKGAYSGDLHEAIRDVRRAFANADFDRIGSCLNALLDICAPEIRASIVEEWNETDRKYHNKLERVKNADFKTSSSKAGWGEDYRGKVTYYINVPLTGLTQYSGRKLEQETRNSFLKAIWNEIYHERFKACIDCLDRHGELRKWRDVSYGKV